MLFDDPNFIVRRSNKVKLSPVNKSHQGSISQLVVGPNNKTNAKMPIEAEQVIKDNYQSSFTVPQANLPYH